jgi:hypothetical protein
MNLGDGLPTSSETAERKEINSYTDYKEVCKELVAKTEGREFTEQDALALVGARFEFLSKVKGGQIGPIGPFGAFGTTPVDEWSPTLLDNTKATLDGGGWNDTSRNIFYIALESAGVFDEENPAIKYLTTLWSQAEQA